MSVLNDVARDLHQNGMPWLEAYAYAQDVDMPAATQDSTTIQEWMGREGSMGEHRDASKDPYSPFAVSLSKALAACLRHGHKPRLEVDAAGWGWARVQDVLSWPRVRELAEICLRLSGAIPSSAISSVSRAMGAASYALSRDIRVKK